MPVRMQVSQPAAPLHVMLVDAFVIPHATLSMIVVMILQSPVHLLVMWKN